MLVQNYVTVTKVETYFLAINLVLRAKIIHTHIYVHIHIYTHIWIYTHPYTHIWVCTHIHIYIYTHTHPYMNIYKYHIYTSRIKERKSEVTYVPGLSREQCYSSGSKANNCFPLESGYVTPVWQFYRTILSKI